MHRWATAGTVALGLVTLGTLLTSCGQGSPNPATSAHGGPAKKYDCAYNAQTEAFTGADGTASAIGWEGNYAGVVTCLGGTFFVQNGINHNFGFGIYDGSKTTWSDADGYLPAQTTSFNRFGAHIAITEFADKVEINQHAFVAVYSRVVVHNPTHHIIIANPQASPRLTPLNNAPNEVKALRSVSHDYVIASDRFGNQYPWPTAQALDGAGGFDQHLAHMERFWNQQLSEITGISVPDRTLEDAYRSGFIYTQIARSGNALHSGVNGYESEYNHDVIGILANFFTQGYFSDAHALLLEARLVIGSDGGGYDDGTWMYSWPWAIYLMKTGDIQFVKKYFATQGPMGSSQPSIEDTAHAIAAARTGPGGIMESTDDIDSQGYWTTDDFEALLGLAAYRYLAQEVGDSAEVTWATGQYDALLAATNQTLDSTIARYGLDYLPCSMIEPDTANRCSNPEDANWASPLGRWAWDGSLFGATQNGPGVSLIDATYAFGFGRLHGVLPPNTFGGFPGDYYSSGYNAGEGSAGLAGTAYRDQGILGYEFMIKNSQSGPYSWWESSSAPTTDSPWTGEHPTAGQGASPHAWGMAQANNVLLDSLVAQDSDGTLIVGRGVPSTWLTTGAVIAVSHFPTTHGSRINLKISTSGLTVSLALQGETPSSPVVFQLPSFINNIAAASAGTVDEQTGTVAYATGTSTITVQLQHAPVNN